jgi:hypothetical protein
MSSHRKHPKTKNQGNPPKKDDHHGEQSSPHTAIVEPHLPPSPDDKTYTTKQVRDRLDYATFLVGIITLVVLAIYTGINYGLYNRTSEQLGMIRDSQRPYVSLGRKDGTLAEFVEPRNPQSGQRGGMKIYFQNGGQSPALTTNVGFLTGVVLTNINGKWQTPAGLKSQEVFHNLLRYRDNKGGSGEYTGSGSIAPQSEYVAFVSELLTQEQLNSMAKGESTLMLQGMIEYCDGFGRYYCRQFTLFFDGPPINAFSEHDEFSCADWYRYPPRQPGQTYLPPCEQPDERDARQKKENQDIAKNAIMAATIGPTALPSPTPGR